MKLWDDVYVEEKKNKYGKYQKGKRRSEYDTALGFFDKDNTVLDTVDMSMDDIYYSADKDVETAPRMYEDDSIKAIETGTVNRMKSSLTGYPASIDDNMNTSTASIYYKSDVDVEAAVGSSNPMHIPMKSARRSIRGSLSKDQSQLTSADMSSVNFFCGK